MPIATLRTDKDSQDISFIPLNGNPLDVAFTGNTIIVSTDNIHEAGSATDIDGSEVCPLRLRIIALLD
jgi:hypothetical protein